MTLMQLEETWPFARDQEHPILPPPRLTELRKLGPVDIRLYDGTQTTLFTSYDDVVTIMMASEQVSADGRIEGFPYISQAARFNRGTRPTMDRLDPPEHDLQRAMLAPHVTVKKVAAMRPFVERFVEELLDRMAEKERVGGTVDLVADYAQLIPAAVICALLDFPLDDIGFFFDRVNIWMNDKGDPADILKATSDMNEYFDRVIEERRGGSGEDLITVYVRDFVDTGKLSHEAFLYQLHELITGGFDTTANTISLGTISLLEQHDQWELLVDGDDEFISKAVEEILRYVSTAHNSIFRLTLRDLEVAGTAIPARRAVIASQMAANHDPAHYPDPDRIDLTRDARDHVAFGRGLHQCIGQALARMELRVAFGALSKRYPNLMLLRASNDLPYRTAVVYGVDSAPVSLGIR